MSRPTLPRGFYADGTEHFAKVRSRKGKRKLALSFRVLAPSPIRAAYVRTTPDGEGTRTPMRCAKVGPFQRWHAQIPIRERRVAYRFEIIGPGFVLHGNQTGLHRIPPFDGFDFVWLDDSLPVPWLEGRTFYQIFPDRFAMGDPGLRERVGHHEYWGNKSSFRRWGERPKHFRKGHSLDFYGGDLAGIEEKVPYLQDLGVGAVYFNPVFQSPSNHRYDTEDYRRIDPRLGTNEDFARLVATLHDGGLRVVLDAVFNHCGATHPWFDRLGKNGGSGAYGNPGSPYRDFFVFDDAPPGYHCWLGVETLPKLNLLSRKLAREIFAGPRSIAKTWLKAPYCIDGWRFDVANMLGRDGAVQIQRELWPQLRRHLKAARSDAYLLGEHFFDPGELVAGDSLDGVMNYKGFYFPLLRWLLRAEPQAQHPRGRYPTIDYGAEDLARELVDAAGSVPHQILMGQLNLLGSHDTARILTLCKGNSQLVGMAATLMMTWPGVPCIYYGDEIGMEGGPDPDCRRCMVWDESRWNVALRRNFQTLATLRRDWKALAAGGVRVLAADGDVFSFARIHGDQIVIVALNRSKGRKTLSLSLRELGVGRAEAVDGLAGACVPIRRGRLELSLPPWGRWVARLAS